MAFKFPFTNYHELNLTWILEQLKSLFEQSEENVTTIETYENRLTAVETELPTVSETASEASRAAAAAGTLAQTAKATADTAQENAVQAHALAGTARQEAQAAQTAANEATQAAQQAQATAQNFDGRITQAENDASQALEASRSFENRVQSAITTANNAAQTATNAQGIAMRADQNAGAALDKIGDLSQLTTTAKQNLVVAVNEVKQIASGAVTSVNGKTGAAVLDASDIGYNDTTVETALDGKQNAPTAAGTEGQVLGLDNNLQPVWVDQTGGDVINTVSGVIASFPDGANDRPVEKLVINIEPYQSGTGDPSPDNIRPFSGWTGVEVYHTGLNIWDEEWEIGDLNTNTGANYPASDRIRSKNYIPCKKNSSYYWKSPNNGVFCFYGKDKSFLAPNIVAQSNSVFTTPQHAYYMRFSESSNYGLVYKNDLSINYPSTDTDYHSYAGALISVPFPQSVGTIYGGKADVVNGNLDSNMRLIDLGDLNWSKTEGYRFYGRVTDPKYFGKVICDTYRFNDASSADKVIFLGGIGWYAGYIVVQDYSYEQSTAEEFKAAVSGIKAAYELETPAEYQLTPQEVKTLLGVNNIWSNAGPVGEVQYPADTKLYIDNKIAELQALILEH